MADLASTLREVRPDVAVDIVGGQEVFRFRQVTPAHTFEAVVKDVGGRMIELTARDSFDERLAAFLLDTAADVGLPGPRARTIRVVAAEFPPPWEFGAVVVVPPVIAKRFEHESAVLRRVTYWVLPAFAGEFTDGADGSAFWHQLERKDGWRSVVVRWDRSRKTRPVFDA
ncbi:hypothetical protein [Gemmata sp.]|uniref:hypothetical protein n=1 Tax=Gemmata sp. TaxID=1914242 RepID=UPI003F6F8A7C